MKALIVEDDRDNAAFVAKGLFGIGLTSEIAADGETGLARLSDGGYDLAIVDVQLPGISGLELVRQVREGGNRLPILILSSLNQPADKISGLNIGADDYLSKPFALNELTARVNAVLRRSIPAPTPGRLTVRDLTLDVLTRHVVRGGRTVSLTQKEYVLLECLCRNAGRTVSVGMILREVWQCDSAPLTTVVETMVCKLRRKLCERGESDLIRTVRGFGYVLA